MGTQEDLPCMRMFGRVHGEEIIELVERTTGERCPCQRGQVCPLLAQLTPPPGAVAS